MHHYYICIIHFNTIPNSKNIGRSLVIKAHPREGDTLPTLFTRRAMLTLTRNERIRLALICTCGACGSVLVPLDEVAAAASSSGSPVEKLVRVAVMSHATSRCPACGYDCASERPGIMTRGLSEDEVVRRLNLVSEEDAQLVGSPMRPALGNITNKK